MNKIYTFFLLIFSFFIFSHTNALQEYSLGSTAQWGNLQYAYNQGTSPRFLLLREVGGAPPVGCPTNTAVIYLRDIDNNIIDCQATTANFVGLPDAGGMYPGQVTELPLPQRVILVKTLYQVNSGYVKACYMMILGDKIIQDVACGPTTSQASWWQRRPFVAIYGGNISIGVGTDTTPNPTQIGRNTYSLTTGAVVTTDTTVPMTITPWTYYASESDRMQVITYSSPHYSLVEHTLISPGVWGTQSSYIFEGAILGGELARLELSESLRTNVTQSIFRSYDTPAGDRVYLLSQCRISTPFATTLPGHNQSWTGLRAASSPGTIQGFVPPDSPGNPVYIRYVYNGWLINQLDNNWSVLPINYGAQCSRNYVYSHFIGNVPSRVYLIRGNTLYVNILSAEDMQYISGNTAGGAAGGGIPDPTYEDQWAACKATENDWTQFLGCLGSFFSYLGEQIINFFKAIPAWINKMLEIWTTDTRKISFFPTAYAGGGGIAGLLLPDRDPSYGESTIGQIDGMLTGIVFAMIFIITLVVILYITRK